MKKFDLNRDVNDNIKETEKAVEAGYQAPELLEIGLSKDLVQGTSCCGPYDGRGYYPQ